MGVNSSTVVPVSNLTEFFKDSVDSALTKHKVKVNGHTAHYVVNLLTMFARSEQFYRGKGGRRDTKPLAFMLSDALDSVSIKEQTDALKRLGDVALFKAGFFAHGFASKAVDIDYYVHMGGNAYGSLSDLIRGTTMGSAYRDVFDELARKFQALVDVLGEISDTARVTNDRDTLRLFDVWRKTGSKRAERQLRNLGIYALHTAASRKH